MNVWGFPTACTDLKTNAFCCIAWFVWISHNRPLNASVSFYYFWQLITHLLFIEIPFSTVNISHKLEYGLQITQRCKGGYERTMSGSMSPSEGAGEEADRTFTGCQLTYSHKQAVIVSTITKTIKKKQNAPSPPLPLVSQMWSSGFNTGLRRNALKQFQVFFSTHHCEAKTRI